MGRRRLASAAALLVLLLPAWAIAGQGALGQLSIRVTDPSGAPVQAAIAISNDVTRTRQELTTDAAGAASIRDLPFGAYHVNVRSQGFAPYDAVVDVRSVVPLDVPVALRLSGVEAAVTVRPDSDTLLDPHAPGPLNYIGTDVLQNPPSSAPGRELISLVNAQPGWILEANGTLHPRGSEYQVQYVVDGVPLRDNRSPAFSRAMSAEEYEAVSVRTAGYPAEYGGKLGGVIDVTTKRETRAGWHGSAAFEGASFASLDSRVSARYVKGRTGAGFSAEAVRTDRYLDPPSEANANNSASGTGLSAHFDHRWTSGDRTRVYVERQQTTFLVPNEAFQQLAGQRQERRGEELRAQASHQHLISTNALLELAAMTRATRGTLTANELSLPIRPSQDRGLRQGYAKASLSLTVGPHEIKVGAEAAVTRLREQFSSTITAYELGGLQIFDRDLPEQFDFSDTRTQHDQSAFVQDLIRAGNVSASLGLRYDRTRLTRVEQGWSPRLAVSWHIPSASTVVRVSYDRVFQTPETENLLLASANLRQQLGASARTLPLLASRGNFYEVGLSRVFFGHVRLDGTYFRRDAENFADDDLLLNTAVAFPIAFASGRIQGMEIKLDMPVWNRLALSGSYSLSKGTGRLPIAGGLFLGPDVDELLSSSETFPITQDQRHTLRARVQRQFGARVSIDASARYDSGLPVELDEAIDAGELRALYGHRIVERVNFEEGRVKPSFALDAGLSLTVWSRGDRAVRAHVGVTNLTNRLNVINFAGLLSGTAIATPRAWAARLTWEF